MPYPNNAHWHGEAASDSEAVAAVAAASAEEDSLMAVAAALAVEALPTAATVATPIPKIT